MEEPKEIKKVNKTVFLENKEPEKTNEINLKQVRAKWRKFKKNLERVADNIEPNEKKPNP